MRHPRRAAVENGLPELSVLKGVVVLDNPDATLMMRVKRYLATTRTHRLGTVDIQIHDHRILPASDYDRFTGNIWPGVDFLMRDVGRHVNEVPRIGLSAEFQPIAPPHARAASDDVKHSLHFTMMVRTRSGVWLNDHGTRPQLTCTGPRVSNGGSSCHSRSLRRVCVQLTRVHDLYAMFFPVQCFSPASNLRRHE